MATIITKNSSTAGAVPIAGDLVQGEIAVNVTDKKLYTKNASGTVVDITPVPPYGLKNKLYNAQGLINQRGYSSGTATTGANQYTLDRWRVVTSGQNLTFSTSANEVTFTAPSGGIEQVIEGLNLESGTYTLSWTGTATATVGGTSVSNGGAVSITGGTNTTVKFSSGTFKNPQLEKGSTATSFDSRPYGTELALCQRYYYRMVGTASGRTSFLTGGVSSTTTAVYCASAFPVPMRSSPSSTYSGINISDANINAAITSITVNLSSTTNASLNLTCSGGGLTTGRPASVVTSSSTSDFIDFSAEL